MASSTLSEEIKIASTAQAGAWLDMSEWHVFMGWTDASADDWTIYGNDAASDSGQVTVKTVTNSTYADCNFNDLASAGTAAGKELRYLKATFASAATLIHVQAHPRVKREALVTS